MTANERLAEIKAQLAEVEVAWELSLSEIDEVSDTLRSLVTALEAVLDEHSSVDYPTGHPFCPTCSGPGAPDFDRIEYPCPTVEAITEALGVDQ